MQETHNQDSGPGGSAADQPAEESAPVVSAADAAKARAQARADEDARITATGRDEWHYIQNDQQFGPVPLAELKSKVSDLSISPPIKLAWHEGMEDWKPVYEIPKVCGVNPLAATQAFKLPRMAAKPESEMDMEGETEEAE